MEFKELEAMTESHECAQCGKPLVVIHSSDSEEWLLVCGTDRKHAGVKSRESTKTALARGHVDKRLGKGAQDSLEKSMAQRPPELSLMSRADIGTGEILQTPNVAGLVQYAQSIGLNALLGHVCLYFGEPYVTIDGYYYLLDKRGSGIQIGTRPLDKEERELYGIPTGAAAWIAESYRDGVKQPTSGLGVITAEEMNTVSKRDPSKFRAPIAHDKPYRMAEKRAEWQLLRKIVPISQNEPTGSGNEAKV